MLWVDFDMAVNSRYAQRATQEMLVLLQPVIPVKQVPQMPVTGTDYPHFLLLIIFCKVNAIFLT